MKGDTYEELCGLVEKHGIVFKSPNPVNWPASYKEIFGPIRAIRYQRFDDYCKAGEADSEHQSKLYTKKRAESLANSANRLFAQRANEQEWRYTLERDFLLRFGSEVVCPKCRARTWQADFEAYIDPAEDIDNLRERRKKRVLCSCEDFHPQDAFNDTGGDHIFGSRLDKVIIQDSELSKRLKQKPDQVVGLQKTKAFENVLGKSGIDEVIRRFSPFARSRVPLLMPFLIVEAKADNSSDGFDNILMQTAFPIWALLRMQENLRDLTTGYSSQTSPLVWFIANRGDCWRLYGCCVTKGAKYEIIQLWDGCLVENDDCLQLLLIIDYIFDWARDVYRRSILRQLKSFASGTSYGEVNLSYESDMELLCEKFRNTRVESFDIRATEQPDIMETVEEDPEDISESIGEQEEEPSEKDEDEEGADEEGEDEEAEDEEGDDEEGEGERSEDDKGNGHDLVLPTSIPDTELGSLRSACVVDYRISGVRMNKRNTKAMLRLAEGTKGSKSKSQDAARKALNLMARWDEVISLSEDDLNYLEVAWTNATSETNRSLGVLPTTTFYVLIEFATFMKDEDWTIAKEISYFAISKSALSILMEAAAYKRRNSAVESIRHNIRPCSRKVWRQTVQCLRRGSSRQNFIAAVSCVLISLCPLPKREGEGQVPPVEALGFEYVADSQLRSTIESFFKYGEELQPWNGIIPLKIEAWDNEREAYLKKRLKELSAISFAEEEYTLIRVLDTRKLGRQQHTHSGDSCRRCQRMDRKYPDCHVFRRDDSPVVSKHGMALVETIRYTSKKPFDWSKHDLCLFALDAASKHKATPTLDTIVRDILRTGKIYHTIRHPLPCDLQDEEILWNLPPPYYPLLEQQREHVEDWQLELRGDELNSDGQSSDGEDSDGEDSDGEGSAEQPRSWDRLQILLHLLRKGLSYNRAVKRLPTPEEADFNAWITVQQASQE